MNAVFIAINGDDVGSSIGNAIASDNHEELARVSGSVKDSHGKIEEWVQSVGGRVVTSSGDEGIYQVPAESVDQLEQIRAEYAQSSGHTLTIGVGNSMSEASKALIYGKYSDKDQIVHYEPAIEDYISQDEEGMEPEMPGAEEGVEEQTAAPEDQAIAPEEEIAPAQDMAPEDQAMAPEQEMAPAQGAIADEQAMAREGSEMPIEGDETAEVGIGEEDNAGINTESVGEKGGEELIDDVVEEGTDGKINGQAPEQAMVGDEESMAGEEEVSEDEQHEQYLTDMISGHMEGEEGAPEQDMGMEQDMGAEEIPMEGEAQMAPEELGQEDIVGQEQEMMPEGEEEEGGGDDELRSDITQALMSFKQNKQMLEETQQSNPELYTATITMLRAMIEMSKRLGFAPQGMEGEEVEGGIEGEVEDVAEEEVDEHNEEQHGEGEEEDSAIEEEVEVEAGAEMPGAEDEEENVKGKFGKK